MTKDEVLKLAFVALKNGKKVREGGEGTVVQPVLEDAAIAAIEESLAEPEQAPDLTEAFRTELDKLCQRIYELEHEPVGFMVMERKPPTTKEKNT
jgi:hypothetical protein